LIKPYHGVSWLENLGDLKFEPRPLGPLYGAHRARAADLDGDGDLDVVASSFLAGLEYGRERAALNADAVVLFEQTSPGVFTRHALEWVTCDYPTLCLGDLDLDGDTDLLLGSFHNATPFTSQPPPPTPADRESVVVLENLAKSPARQ
jgi:hypothetical protein